MIPYETSCMWLARARCGYGALYRKVPKIEPVHHMAKAERVIHQAADSSEAEDDDKLVTMTRIEKRQRMNIDSPVASLCHEFTVHVTSCCQRVGRG